MRFAGVRRGVLLSLVFLLVALPLPMVADDVAPNQLTAAPIPLPGVNFVHVASTDNIDANTTYLDHPLLNSDDSAVFFATQNYNPKDLSGTYNAEAIGVWYNGAIGRWGIFNQDRSDMPEEAAFNIHIPVEDSTVFIHEATGSNTMGIRTIIDNPLLNSSPSATLFVTQNWNPPGEVGIYNDHIVAVYYSTIYQKWAVANQDQEDLSLGASFNILVASADETAIVHVATSGNTTGSFTTVDDPRINNNPNALLTVTKAWIPVGVWNPHPFGISYADGSWRVFNQDGEDIPENAGFNILIPPTDSAAFTHVAADWNTSDNHTRIDHPLLDDNRDTIALVTQNANPGGGFDGVYNDHHIGIFYSIALDKWYIFNQDGAAMPVGAAFNIYVPPIGANAFTQVATPDNTDFDVTYIHHPETNGDPHGIILFTPNWNPRRLSGTYNDHATGIWYSDAEAKASIFNEDDAAMPLDAAFNVLIPDENAVVFTHTATDENSFQNSTALDHPLLNGNRDALIYVTHNWNPGGGLDGVYNNQALAVWFNEHGDRWGIFNQDTSVDMPEGAVFNVLVIAEYKVFLPLVLRSY